MVVRVVRPMPRTAVSQRGWWMRSLMATMVLAERVEARIAHRPRAASEANGARMSVQTMEGLSPACPPHVGLHGHGVSILE